MSIIMHLLTHGILAALVVTSLNQFGAGIEFSVANWIAATTLLVAIRFINKPVNSITIIAPNQGVNGETE